MMNLNNFKELPFVQQIRENNRWTVVTNKKMPIDIMALCNEDRLVGASFAKGNQPLTTLDRLCELLPNATNATYSLRQSLDNIVILDIEPKCPRPLCERLLKLPSLYAEKSMSGKGYHLVMPKPDTKYQDILLAKTALQHKQGYYEILLTHYITFTGNEIERPENPDDISEFNRLFDELAENAKIVTNIECDTSDLPELESIPHQDEIVNTLIKAEYTKKLSDFGDNHSKWEYGIIGFYNYKLNQILKVSAFKDHEYTIQERIVLLHAVVSQKIEHREKHDEARNGLPFLLYSCKRAITSITAK